MTESGDWRSRRWEATHQRIYDVALRLFQEEEFDRVSVGQIAAGAEISVPTFYAHYPSKEHVVMQLPTAEEMRVLIASVPVELPLRDRLRHAVMTLLSTWSAEFREAQLVRWRIIAGSPGLRTRAAEFERTTGGLIIAAMQAGGAGLRPADAVIVHAYMAAFTSSLLAWADGNGERKLEELIDEAFSALKH